MRLQKIANLAFKVKARLGFLVGFDPIFCYDNNICTIILLQTPSLPHVLCVSTKTRPNPVTKKRPQKNPALYFIQKEPSKGSPSTSVDFHVFLLKKAPVINHFWQIVLVIPNPHGKSKSFWTGSPAPSLEISHLNVANNGWALLVINYWKVHLDCVAIIAMIGDVFRTDLQIGSTLN